MILKFVTHSKQVLHIAQSRGWMVGARYTNLRDLKSTNMVGFLDINWKKYDFDRHCAAASQVRPFLTVARDIENIFRLERILRQAYELLKYATHVILVPKDERFTGIMEAVLPAEFLLGYSVPTRYGGTRLNPSEFRGPVHLLGGRPDIQRILATKMPVVSLDCNRFTLDAAFGDFFDGKRFRPHCVGGYENCIRDSIVNINALWESYTPTGVAREWLKQNTPVMNQKEHAKSFSSKCTASSSMT